MTKGKLLAFRRTTPRSPEELSDEALIAACAIGESAALGTLYDRHHRPVSRFVSRLSCGPASDVEDLVQCTFIEVWKSAARFHKRGAVRSWIFGISANLSRHYVRSEVRRRTAMDGLSARPQGEAARPDDRAERAELVDRLGQALAALSYEQRVAFVLCDIEEMSGVEAAHALGIRKGTLWRRLHDARKSLRAALEEGAS
jgi:RNA polymerase sigma-70 factor (ECF subfamily)